MKDELDKIYAPEINMVLCINEGNCWNGQASIEERCYYPIGFRPLPDDDPSNDAKKLLVDLIVYCFASIMSFLVK